MKKSTKGAAVGAAGLALSLGLAAPAFAQQYPPPVPTPNNATASATSVVPGQAVTITFGGSVPYLPGTTVTVTTVCTTTPSGLKFAGPSTSTTANGSGQATVSLTFGASPNGETASCVVTAVGLANLPTAGAGFAKAPAAVGEIASSVTITIRGSGGGGGGGGGSSTGGGALPKTGGNDTLVIAALGGGLLLAGVGAVAVARRRERTSS